MSKFTLQIEQISLASRSKHLKMNAARLGSLAMNAPREDIHEDVRQDGTVPSQDLPPLWFTSGGGIICVWIRNSSARLRSISASQGWRSLASGMLYRI